MGKLFGGGKKAARIQAQATIDTANKQAEADRLVAQATQQSRETAIAQNQAATAATSMLAAPAQQVDVQLSSDSTDAEVDPDTGRRRTTRSTFMSSGTPGSGIKL